MGRRHGSRRAAPGNPSAPRQVLRTLIERQGAPSYGPAHESTAASTSPQAVHAQGGLRDGSSSCAQATNPSAPQPVDNNSEQSQETKGGSPSSFGDRQSESPNYQLVAGGSRQQPAHPFGAVQNHELQGMGHEDKPRDCAVDIMSLQEQLEGAYRTLCSTASQPRQSLMGSVDAAIESISSGLDRLSTVLICPCSERLDISLLVGAACMSVMDVYGLIVKLSSSPPHLASWVPHRNEQSSAGNSRNASIAKETTFEEEDQQYWALSSLSPRSQDRSQRMSSLMDLDGGEPREGNRALERIVEELPKLAGVTLQFTKRSRTMHGSHNIAAVSEVAYALASYTRTRLQSLKNEVTGQLLHGT